MSVENSETAPLLSNDLTKQEEGSKTSEVAVYQTYCHRWYVLTAFSLFSFVQTLVWNTWGPISISAKAALDFTDHDIELFANWVTIATMPGFPLFVFLLNKKGLRISVLLGALACATGTVLRCFPVNKHGFKYLVHIGQFLNGLAACPVLGVPPLISSVWFPPGERVTATTCLLLLGNIGNAFSYFVGPQIVEHPSNANTTGLLFSVQGVENVTNVPQMRNQINHLMYIHCGMAVFVFLCILVFFPSQPPSPPSPTAAADRLSFISSLKHLVRVPSFWVIIFTQSTVMGAYFGWSGVLADLYSKFGISQNESGIVGTAMTLAGVFAGIVIGWFVDRFKRQIKNILVVIGCVIFIVFLYLVVASMQWIDWPPFHFTSVTMWICCIIIGITINSFQPLIVELAVDHAFPVSEGTSNSILMWFSMTSMFVFLTISNAVPDQTIANYLLLVFTGISIPFFMFLVPQRSERLDIDLQGGRYINDDVSGTEIE